MTGDEEWWYQSQRPGTADVLKTTLLSTVGKAFMTILNSRLAKWLDSRSILVNEQAGFREGYSTVNQVFILNELICRQKRRKRVCAFLDIKRAYDVVWRDAMWKALWDVGVRGRMWRMLQGVYRGVQLRRRRGEQIGLGALNNWSTARMRYLTYAVCGFH